MLGTLVYDILGMALFVIVVGGAALGGYWCIKCIEDINEGREEIRGLNADTERMRRERESWRQ